MTRNFDVEFVLRKLTWMRNSIPGLQHRPLRPAAAPTPADIAAFIPAGVLADAAMEAFELMAVADALQSFAGDLQATIEEREAKLMDDCLRVYYAALELSAIPLTRSSSRTSKQSSERMRTRTAIPFRHRPRTAERARNPQITGALARHGGRLSKADYGTGWKSTHRP